MCNAKSHIEGWFLSFLAHRIFSFTIFISPHTQKICNQPWEFMEGVCSHPRLRLPSGNVVGHGHKGLCNFSRSFFTLIHVSREKEVINLDESIICLCSKDLFLKTWTNHVHNCVAWNVYKTLLQCYNWPKPCETGPGWPSDRCQSRPDVTRVNFSQSHPKVFLLCSSISRISSEPQL